MSAICSECGKDFIKNCRLKRHQNTAYTCKKLTKQQHQELVNCKENYERMD